MINCIVIDDDTLMRQVLKEMISKHPDLNFVAEFNNAIDASVFIKKNKIDLIFLDIEMPQMTGMEFLEAFENILPDIIITSSHRSFALDAFKYNVSGYLVKPVKSVEFHKSIQKINKTKSKQGNKENNSILFVKKGTTAKK
jgi:two-component SAPR family response regulator